jgi:hypothetical protein
LRWGKAWVGEGAHGDTHRRFVVTFFGVEHGRPADRAEPEPEPGFAVANANVLSCGAEDLIGRGEGGQRGKHTARPTLTGKAVAHADAERLALNFDTQLTAGTRGCPGTHRGTSWDVVREPHGLAGGLLAQAMSPWAQVMLPWKSGNAADCGAS